MTDAYVKQMRDALLEYFDAAARDLPWRRTRDPYAIWISEVMSQQTRVETAVPYYENWLERFPDVDALAAAPLDDVLKAWEGLGYYSRARNLHAAAAVVRERHAGALPSDIVGLRALPGIGDYTAGAVASIAYGVKAPAVDGNVRRVLSRLFDEPAPAAAWLRDTATRLVPADRPGDFNQSIMELGARICTPRRPACPRCPVADLCAARAAGTQLQRPAPTVRRSIPTVPVATLVLRRVDGSVLLVRRPPHGLLAGMWTFPGIECAPDEEPENAAIRLGRSITSSLPQLRSIGQVSHTFSHRREVYACFVADITDDVMLAPPASGAGVATGHGTIWLGQTRGDIALPRAQQKIHALATAALTAGTERAGVSAFPPEFPLARQS